VILINQKKKRKIEPNSSNEDDDNIINSKKNLDPTVLVKSTIINNKKEHCPPYILTFPHGPPHPGLFSGDPRESKYDWMCYCKTSSGEEWKRKIISETERIKYRGTNYGKFSSKNESSQYIIGIYSKKSGTLKLHKTDHIYRMDQIVKNYKSDVDLSHVQNMDYYERRKLLIDTFGSKRNQRIQDKRRANRITDEIIVGLEEITKEQIVKVKENKEKKKRNRFYWFNKEGHTSLQLEGYQSRRYL